MGSKENTTAPAAKQTPAAPADAVKPADAAKEPVVKEPAGKGKLYKVASPIKHNGELYNVGDNIRLPEAVANRLAGYLQA